MANGNFVLSVLLLVFVNGFFPSASSARQSALTLDLGRDNNNHTLQSGKEITIEIVTHDDQIRKVTITGSETGNKSHYEKKILGPSLLQKSEYQFQSEQKIIKSVTLTSTAAQICVNALVVDTIIVVDQPTDFQDNCSSASPEELERPCKQFGVSINVSRLFVCPERLKDLLLKKKLVQLKNEAESAPEIEPPTYNIKNDMLQASSAIAAGITGGIGTITEAVVKYRKARKAKPLKILREFAKKFVKASSFIGAIAPMFGVFSGIVTIATTFLTPNPFDELAKFLDDEFKQINNQLTDIQADIADLGRLIEAQGGVLAMAEQLSAIRYTIRNYGVLVDAISTKPVCGARELSKMPEVEDFMRQYQYDFVDNRLLDLYGVEFGELAEVTSLLTPYMRLYCHNKKHLVQKFAQELIYYGYAGLQSHFTYLSLLDATKGLKSGLDIEANSVLMTKFYKFVKVAEAFRQASLSEPGRALQLKLEDEILAEVKKDEANITDWLKKRITNTNDWPDLCLLKDAGKKENNTLVIQYQRIKEIKRVWAKVMCPEKLLTNETWDNHWKAVCESEHTYVRAPKKEVAVLDSTECKEREMRDNVMFVSYYPNPS